MFSAQTFARIFERSFGNAPADKVVEIRKYERFGGILQHP